MRTITRIIFSLLLLVAASPVAQAQSYCNVTTASAYTMQMPGITNFQLGTINRTSLGVECGSVNCNSVVSTSQTQQTTNLEQGKQYTISMTHSKDQANFPNARNNLRVYIDFNKNGTLNDATETVMSMDLQTPGTQTANFTVPANATLGTTRLRATAKMSADAGHSLPTPCDIPVDNLGYHGEIEDYTVTIIQATGITENNASALGMSVYPNPFTQAANVAYTLTEKAMVTVEVFNILGEKVATLVNENQSAGNYLYDISAFANKGVYFVKLTAGDKTGTQRLVQL